jgi:hypothetical protein
MTEMNGVSSELYESITALRDFRAVIRERMCARKRLYLSATKVKQYTDRDTGETMANQWINQSNQ